MKNKFSLEKGFTVLELLIVLFIMTILLSIALVSFTRGNRNTQNKTRIADFQLVQLALEEYRGQCKVYPEELVLDADNNYPGASPYSSTQDCSIEFGQMLPPQIATKVDDGVFEYISLKNGNSQNGVCTAYHLSTKLLDPSGFLEQDDDYGGDPAWPSCASGINHVDQVDPWYDVVYGTNQ